MRPQILRLCALVRVRSWSHGDVVPRGAVEEIIATLGELDERLGRDVGTMLHKRRQGRVTVEDVMEFVDLWLQSVGSDT